MKKALIFDKFYFARFSNSSLFRDEIMNNFDTIRCLPIVFVFRSN